MPDFPSFLAPVFDPLLVRWLAELLHPGVDAGDMRAALRRAYLDAFAYELDDEAIDALLAVEANGRSFGYGRFSSERRASAK
jgi:iron complex transport system substrate-binding protein